MPVLWTSNIEGLVRASTEEQALAQSLFDSANISTFEERVYLCPACSSALDVAHHLAQKGDLDVWDSVLTLRQWSGRGQLRRKWISEPGNLFVAWRLPVPNDGWGGLLSILVGFVICHGLREWGLEVCLKWPNDLLWQNGKIGGILIEERGDVLLAGIGINLLSHPTDTFLRAGHAFPAQSLGNALPHMSVLDLWLQLVHFARFRYLFTLSYFTPQEFVRSIESTLAFLGDWIHLEDHDSLIQGTYVGLSPDGGIILRAGSKTQTMYSGSLSLGS